MNEKISEVIDILREWKRLIIYHLGNGIAFTIFRFSRDVRIDIKYQFEDEKRFSFSNFQSLFYRSLKFKSAKFRDDGTSPYKRILSGFFRF